MQRTEVIILISMKGKELVLDWRNYPGLTPQELFYVQGKPEQLVGHPKKGYETSRDIFHSLFFIELLLDH